jgi:Ca2+/Na+ antiporter
MNKIDFRTILYILIGVLVLGVFFKILPYLIVGGFVIYLVLKVYGLFKNKSDNKENEKSSSYAYNEKNENYSEDEVDTNEAIDVDYKDV